MKKKKSEYKKHHVIILIFLTIFSLIMMYPMAWMLVTSFKTNADIRANRTKFLPTEWTLEGYRTAFAKAPIGQWFLNSMLAVSYTHLDSLFDRFRSASQNFNW